MVAVDIDVVAGRRLSFRAVRDEALPFAAPAGFFPLPPAETRRGHHDGSIEEPPRKVQIRSRHDEGARELQPVVSHLDALVDGLLYGQQVEADGHCGGSPAGMFGSLRQAERSHLSRGGEKPGQRNDGEGHHEVHHHLRLLDEFGGGVRAPAVHDVKGGDDGHRPRGDSNDPRRHARLEETLHDVLRAQHAARRVRVSVERLSVSKNGCRFQRRGFKERFQRTVVVLTKITHSILLSHVGQPQPIVRHA